MMDVITGKTRPDEGDVVFAARHRPHDARRGRRSPTLGIGRKFQKPTVFESHTVAENLELALEGRARRVRASLLPAVAARERERIDEILEHDRPRAIAATGSPASLSHGQKQWLEIGMLLVQDPKLLLVDEPVAGMTDAETERTAELLRAHRRDPSVVVVEHDMDFVRDARRAR